MSELFKVEGGQRQLSVKGERWEINYCQPATLHGNSFSHNGPFFMLSNLLTSQQTFQIIPASPFRWALNGTH